MKSQTENISLSIGRRVAELRKQKHLSQHDLASKLSKPRTQAWLSNVESGRRNLHNQDLFEIATILEITPGDLFDHLSDSQNPSSKSLGEILKELSERLPIEIPVFLQRDLSDLEPEPIDHQYRSNMPAVSVFNADHPLAQSGDLSVMVVERHYTHPKIHPSDLLTFSSSLIPVPDPDHRMSERIIVVLKEPLDGLHTHVAVCKNPGQIEIALNGQSPVVLTGDEFKLLGVVIVRRTFYKSSVIRTWLQRTYGIIKDERFSEDLSELSGHHKF
jgi:transcriptional regulator with XRE-family HTH domain